jgi:hypothetical protein
LRGGGDQMNSVDDPAINTMVMAREEFVDGEELS